MNTLHAPYQVRGARFGHAARSRSSRFLRRSGLASILIASALGLTVNRAAAQGTLPVEWERLTSGDFVKAIGQAEGTCLLPFGILEKHGQQLPLGTDLLNVRYVSINAAKNEFAVVFPAYYFGQIFEARHQPGTVAYSANLQLALLEATTDEMARNGCKKVIIVNGHGGNEHLLPYFAQSELAVPHDYVVYIFGLPNLERAGRPAVKSPFDMHAGEEETSDTMISAPDAVHLDRANQESGADLHRLNLPDSLYTGIWWYARFPNHYAGNAAHANRELGEFDMETWQEELVTAIKAVKADNESLKLQKEFYEQASHPLDTKPEE